MKITFYHSVGKELLFAWSEVLVLTCKVQIKDQTSRDTMMVMILRGR